MSEVSKLPKWAQKHIRTLEIHVKEAVRALNRYLDDQTPSAFSTVDYICTGEQPGPSSKRRYIQETRCIEIEYDGNVFTFGFDNHERLILRCNSGRLVFTPEASNSILVCAQNRE